MEAIEATCPLEDRTARVCPAGELAERAGHSRASMSLDVYSHVLMDKSELTAEDFLALIRA
jgi:hypothetical protein